MRVDFIHNPAWFRSAHGMWLHSYMSPKQIRLLARLDPMMIIRV